MFIGFRNLHSTPVKIKHTVTEVFASQPDSPTTTTTEIPGGIIFGRNEFEISMSKYRSSSSGWKQLDGLEAVTVKNIDDPDSVEIETCTLSPQSEVTSKFIFKPNKKSEQLIKSNAAGSSCKLLCKVLSTFYGLDRDQLYVSYEFEKYITVVDKDTKQETQQLFTTSLHEMNITYLR